MRLALLGSLLILLGSSQMAVAEDPPLWTRCFDEVNWFHAAEVPSAEKDLLDLAMSGRLAKWSEDWIGSAIQQAPSIDACLEHARAEKKPLFWYVPSVTGQHMILPNLLDRYVTLAALSEPDVTAILNHRFVTLKLPAGGALAKRFALEAPGFIEPGFLFVTPDGKVLHRVNRVNTFNGHYVADMLRQVLAMPDVRRLSQEDDATPSALVRGIQRGSAQGFARLVETCERWIEQGYDDRAERTLKEAWILLTKLGARAAEVLLPTARWADLAYLQAVVARRARRGEEALHTLAEAVRLGAEDALLGNIGVESGRIQLGLGKNHLARRAFEAVLSQHADCPRAAEARYLLGVAETMDHEDDAALVTWRALVARHPDSIWAARADACAVMGGDARRGESPLMRAMLDPRWLHADAYRLAEDTQWRRTKSDLDDIRTRALDFLIRSQRENGGFVGPRWGAGSNEETDLNMEVAITALCCEALHRWRDADRRAKAALARGEDFLLGSPEVRRGDAPIWVYADGLRLRHFAARIADLDPKRKKAVRKQMTEWVSNLESHQEETNGPFKHFTYTSSFVTAAITCCLHDAKAAGLEVKDETFERACDALLRARGGDEGLFGYLLDRPEVGRSRKGAAQRQPLCEWTLYRSGKADAKRLDAALEVYLETFDESAAVSRKTNFHIPSLDHTAGYYFFHDFLFACECATGCAHHRKVTHLRTLLDLLCALPEIDGSFIDSGLSYGKAYGTAMALISFGIIEDNLPSR